MILQEFVNFSDGQFTADFRNEDYLGKPRNSNFIFYDSYRPSQMPARPRNVISQDLRDAVEKNRILLKTLLNQFTNYFNEWTDEFMGRNNL